MGKLAGKFQGGYGGAKGATNVKGYKSGTGGNGTMPFKTTGRAKTSKDIIAGAGERMPMPQGVRGRVLYSSKNKRIGRQEGTGPES